MVALELVAARATTLLAHVEAGLRSRDWSMPEEINRTVADRLSDCLLAPSPDAVDNLRFEGYRDDQIHLTSNVMIDTLFANRDRALASGSLERLGLPSGDHGLVTLHCPANVDSLAALARLIRALTKISEELPLTLPAQPPRAAASPARTDHHRPHPPAPLAGYLDFVALETGARIVLTDSVGVQEETSGLSVPCMTLC
jgi:UDP-N-acetylglucosamine 2-epimerase (non-hydrolysing)